MSTFRNNRRRAVEPANPFANAEGIVPLAFSDLLLHRLEEKDFTSSRNDLPVTKFTAVNPTNGETIAVLVQCDLRNQVLDAFDRKENGEIPVLKNVYGGRCRRDFKTGMTTIAARSLKIEFRAPNASVSATESASAGPVLVPSESAAAELAATTPASALAQ